MSKTIQIRNLVIGPGIPKIIVPIVGQTREEIHTSAETILAAGPDLVEWRADWFCDVTDPGETIALLSELRRTLKDIPILFTFRTAKEGGEKAIDTDTYIKLNRLVSASGLADLIDVELFTGEKIVREIISDAHSYGVKVIASSHDFKSTPSKEEIISRLKMMDEAGADIPKIAVMPTCRADVITLLDATQEADSVLDKPIITMSMSGTGLISRLAGEAFGSSLTFGSVGKTSAPGQMDAQDLRTILKLIHNAGRTAD